MRRELRLYGVRGEADKDSSQIHRRLLAYPHCESGRWDYVAMNERVHSQETQVLNRSFTPVRSNLLQRKCACGGTPGLDGECAECRRKRLTTQRRSLDQSGPSIVPSVVHDVLHSPGQPLPAGTRDFVESRLGHDFSRVRVHHDAKAAESARTVNAKAYTVGSHVVFGGKQYAPETSEGQNLLVHELTHVVQQRGITKSSPLSFDSANDTSELEARHIASRIHSPNTSHSIFAPSNAVTKPTLARQQPSFGEMWTAVTEVGPLDAWRANRLSDEAKAAARATGLPEPHNGPMDAWRHCYWNCTMTEALGSAQAKTVADSHEVHGGGPANENTMDAHNNAEGRACGGTNCDGCCQDSLDNGRLRIIDSTGTVVPSSRTMRKAGTALPRPYDPQAVAREGLLQTFLVAASARMGSSESCAPSRSLRRGAPFTGVRGRRVLRSSR